MRHPVCLLSSLGKSLCNPNQRDSDASLAQWLWEAFAMSSHHVSLTQLHSESARTNISNPLLWALPDSPQTGECYWDRWDRWLLLGLGWHSKEASLWAYPHHRLKVCQKSFPGRFNTVIFKTRHLKWISGFLQTEKPMRIFKGSQLVSLYMTFHGGEWGLHIPTPG